MRLAFALLPGVGGQFAAQFEGLAELAFDGFGAFGVDPVVDVAAFAGLADDAEGAQAGEVVGNGALGQAEVLGQLGDIAAGLAVGVIGQALQDSQPGDIPDCPQAAGEVFNIDWR